MQHYFIKSLPYVKCTIIKSMTSSCMQMQRHVMLHANADSSNQISQYVYWKSYNTHGQPLLDLSPPSRSKSDHQTSDASWIKHVQSVVHLTRVISWSSAVGEEGRVQVRVCLLQGHTELQEMVALLVHEHLQELVHFLGAGGAVLVQLEGFLLAEASRFTQQLYQPVCIRDGLQ